MDDLRQQANEVDIEAGVSGRANTGQGSQGEPVTGEHIPASEQPTMEGALGSAELILGGAAFVVRLFHGVDCPDEVIEEGAQKFAPVVLKRAPWLAVMGEQSDEAKFLGWLVETGVMIYQAKNEKPETVNDSEPENTETKTTQPGPAPGSVYAAEAERKEKGKLK